VAKTKLDHYGGIIFRIRKYVIYRLNVNIINIKPRQKCATLIKIGLQFTVSSFFFFSPPFSLFFLLLLLHIAYAITVHLIVMS